ncbi:Rab escort protein [Entamoeba marina]
MNPYQEFETDVFDYAILGTGVTESVIAAFLANHNKRIVVVDPHTLYGLHSSFLSYRELEKYASDLVIKYSVEIPLENKDFERAIHIDLTPQLFYSNGGLIKLIAESGVHNYMEFLAIESVHMYINDKIIRVPDSKNTLFTCEDLTLIQKRQLMRFLSDESITSKEEPKETELFKKIEEVGSLRKYLQSIGLTTLCQDIIIYGLCLSSSEDINDATLVLTKLRKYITSTGKYGPTPFIYCRYGFGDVSQAFSRNASISNGIFLCSHTIKEVQFNNNQWNIHCLSPEGRSEQIPFTIKSSNVIKNTFFEESDTGVVSNYLQYFTNVELPFGRRCYIVLPGISKNSIHCIISTLDGITQVCLNVLHSDEDNKDVLEKALSIIYPEYKTTALTMISYSLKLNQWEEVKTVNGATICSDGTIGIHSDIDNVVKEARSFCGQGNFKEEEEVLENEEVIEKEETVEKKEVKDDEKTTEEKQME